MNKREEIVQTAFEIMARDGLEGVHARTVAKDVGVNHAAVHYYFPRRSDLLMGIFEYAKSRYQQDQARFLDGSKNPMEEVESVVEQNEAYCKAGSRYIKVWASLYVAALADEKLKEAMQVQWKESVHALGFYLRNARVKPGPLSDPVMLHSVLIGLGVSAQLVGRPFKVEQCVDAILESLLGNL